MRFPIQVHSGKTGVPCVSPQPLLHLSSRPEESRPHRSYRYAKDVGCGFVRLVLDINQLDCRTEWLIEGCQGAVERGTEVYGG